MQAANAVYKPLRLLAIVMASISIGIGSFLFIGYGRRSSMLVISPDSSTYVGVAENITRGGGFRHQARFWDALDDDLIMGHYPPGYSLFLSLVQMLGGNIKGFSMVVVNTILLMSTALLSGVLAYWGTRSIVWACFGATLVFCCTFELFVRQLSESLYIVLEMINVLLLVFYFRFKRRPILVVAAGIFSGLAWLTRYAGIGIVVPSLLLLLIDEYPDWKSRVATAFLFLFPACLGISVWYFYIFILEDAQVIFNHVMTWESAASNWNILTRNVNDIVGGELALLGVLLIVTVVAVMLILAWYKKQASFKVQMLYPLLRGALTSYSGILIFLSITYTFFIFISATISNVALSWRMIVLVFPFQAASIIALTKEYVPKSRYARTVSLLGVGMMLCGPLVESETRQMLLFLGGTIGLSLLLRAISRVSRWSVDIDSVFAVVLVAYLGAMLHHNLTEGGYRLQRAAIVTRDLASIQWLKHNIPDDATIFTPNVPLVGYFVDQTDNLFYVPGTNHSLAQYIPGNGTESISEFAHTVARTNGYVVFLDHITRSTMISESMVSEYPGFYLYDDMPLGGIYRAEGQLDDQNTLEIQVDNMTVLPGDCTDLHWIAEQGQSVTLNGSAIQPQGTRHICPTRTTTYELSAYNQVGQQITRSVTVDVTNEYTISLWAEALTIYQGDCTSIYWFVEGIREVYFDGSGVIGHSHVDVCPNFTSYYVLKVILSDGRQLIRPIAINVLPMPSEN